MQRQFYRLLEMILLLSLDKSNKKAYTEFRLTVKRRLYAFNREMLAQIEDAERKERLQETFEGVEKDYGRITVAFQ
jgi:histone acetyltransferase 1